MGYLLTGFPVRGVPKTSAGLELMDFNRKQQKFIDLYVHMEDPTRAAIEAGYPKEYGIQLYANPQIRAEIDRKKAIVSEQSRDCRSNTEHRQAQKTG